MSFHKLVVLIVNLVAIFFAIKILEGVIKFITLIVLILLFLFMIKSIYMHLGALSIFHYVKNYRF